MHEVSKGVYPKFGYSLKVMSTLIVTSFSAFARTSICLLKDLKLAKINNLGKKDRVVKQLRLDFKKNFRNP